VSGDFKQPAPVSKIATASENRSISKATPGAPAGNIEKRRNTLPAFHAERTGTILHWWAGRSSIRGMPLLPPRFIRHL
jgi:hypothetical protein